MPSPTGQIVREELWRSVAWAGLGLVGWAILISEFSQRYSAEAHGFSRGEEARTLRVANHWWGIADSLT